MNSLLKQKRIQIILLIVFLVTGFDSAAGARFFHSEMIRQIEETLKTQSERIQQGYEQSEQNREIYRTGIQSEVLELNRIHGDFLLKVMEEFYEETLQHGLEPRDIETQLRKILKAGEQGTALSGTLIPKASGHRNDLDMLIKGAVLSPGQTLHYFGRMPADIFLSGGLDIAVRGTLERPWEIYARAVYYKPLDMIVVLTGTDGINQHGVSAMFQKIQDNMERNVMLAGAQEDVIILQDNGYGIYSGRFESIDSEVRTTRIVYHDKGSPENLINQVKGKHEEFATLKVTTLNGQVQERYGYIRYDGAQQQTIIVSRPQAMINSRENLLVVISLFISAVNITVIGLIAWMLISRDEALEGVGQP